MERRWPWKKKSSDKAATERAATATATVLEPASFATVDESIQNQVQKQENYNKPNYVKISVESYTHFTGLENQVKSYEERFLTLENQVKTYEEQFQTLESQIEELNEKLSQAWSEVETKENLVKQHSKVAEDAVVGWEKAETEVNVLQSQVDSLKLSKCAAEDRAARLDSTLEECMQQIRSMKDYHDQELRDVILSKTKQWDKIEHELETKIANLEQQLLMSDAESAALSRSLQERGNLLVQINEEKSQAEAEIDFFKGKFESCEREISSLKYELHVASKELEIRTDEKNMAVKSADVANKQYLEGVKKVTKLEEECQRLRALVRKKLPGPAALAKMRSEVERLGRDFGNSRPRRSSSPSTPHSMLPDFDCDNLQKCQKDNKFLTDRLLAMEEEMEMLKEALAKRNSELQLSRNVCANTASRLRSLETQLLFDNKNTRRMYSMSDDGIDDSWATASASEVAQAKKDNFVRSNKSDVNPLELMDDFLEMEKLAHTSTESNGSIAHPVKELRSCEKLCDPYESGNSTPSVKEMSRHDETESGQSSLVKLQTRIFSVFESLSPESDIVETVESLKSILQSDVVTENSPLHNNSQVLNSISEDIGAAISQIHEYVLHLRNEISAAWGSTGETNALIEKFLNEVDGSLHGKQSVGEFVVELAQILSLACKFRFSILTSCSSDGETNGSDCVDKIALPEIKSTYFDSRRDNCPNGFSTLVGSPHPELLPNINTSTNPSDELKEIMLEKERLSENLEDTKSRLLEAEHVIAELKSQLTAGEQSNSLAEIQLKCMTESYRSLENHAKELETEVELLNEKTKALELEIQEQKKSNQNTLDTCNHLQGQLEREREISASPDYETNYKLQQEMELAAAAAKLAKCQETISQLGKQFESMRPQPDMFGSPQTDKGAFTYSIGGNPTSTDMYIDPSNSETRSLPRTPAITAPRHRHTMSGSSLSSTPTPEKPIGTSFQRVSSLKRNI